MEIKLDITKTVNENAAEYYEKAKIIKQKIEGAERALEETLKKIEELKKKKELIKGKISIKILKEKKAKEWYEKFRYAFIENFLIVGGKDATSNEILIKKHTEKNDVVMHTDIFGSPFFVVKNGKNANEEILKVAASICASYSKAWKNNLGNIDVYCVDPEQVSKTAPSGEFLAKGSFMIYGEKKWFRNTPLRIYICFKDSEIFITGNGDKNIKNFKHYVCLTPGTEKGKDLVKRMKKFWEKDMEIFPDEEILRLIPYGQGQIIEIK